MSRYERKSEPIRELIGNPDVNVTANALTKSTEGLHSIAPNIAQSLQITGNRALTYLHSKLPKPSSEMVGDSEYQPSKSEQRGWLGLHDIVNDPVSALDHIRHGTLTGSHMDALNQVHPELLNEMREKVMEHMDPDKVRGLPSTTKIALGTFLGSPITQSVNPQAVMANQIALKGNVAPNQQSQGPKSTLGGLKELNLGQRAATETTDLEQVE